MAEAGVTSSPCVAGATDGWTVGELVAAGGAERVRIDVAAWVGNEVGIRVGADVDGRVGKASIVGLDVAIGMATLGAIEPTGRAVAVRMAS